MHTPDGFVTSWICVVMLLLSAAALAYAYLNRREWLTMQKLPSLALVSATIFLLQMLNFPVAGGTSGHFLGAAFATFFLGPAGAIISVSSVLIVQALVFGDGGMLSLGVNVFNMAVVGVFSAHYASKFARRFFADERAGAFAASWFSVFAASASASALLSLSGLAPAPEVFAAMLSVHAIIGLAEGIITVGALEALSAAKASSLSLSRSASYAMLALAVASLALPFASSSPDGMEEVALRLGFFSAATTIYAAPVPDYAVSALPESLSGAGAAAIGAFLCFAIFPALSLALRAAGQKPSVRAQ